MEIFEENKKGFISLFIIRFGMSASALN